LGSVSSARPEIEPRSFLATSHALGASALKQRLQPRRASLVGNLRGKSVDGGGVEKRILLHFQSKKKVGQCDARDCELSSARVLDIKTAENGVRAKLQGDSEWVDERVNECWLRAAN
jgi:hypothetical protein